MESILTSVKKLCGIAKEYTAFDDDIIMCINSVFMILYQIGVGPSESAFQITDETSEWTDFIPKEDKNYESIKNYVAFKVRLMFDPPTSSVLMDSINNTLAELEWRLYLEGENKAKGGDMK